MPPTAVDPRIWRACAGSSVNIPTLNSRVYYFPQGHLEQSFSNSLPATVSNIAFSKPLIPCVVYSVQFLADPSSDEVYAKVQLLPVDTSSSRWRDSFAMMERGSDTDYNGIDDDKIVAFAKVLTPSDANNGGGFSVPRFCADSIFPPLNYQVDPPVQTLTVTDIHGLSWDFRHIFRGTPRRHLLTTGWSKFVNHKKLIAGDSVVFMKNSGEEMFIGVRRAIRSNSGGGGEYMKWRDHIGGVSGEVKANIKEEGFSRNGRGRVSPEAVAEAAGMAAQGLPFEVVYYPRAGWYSDFVVRAEAVESALNVFWTAGMRVKMAMETEDSSRTAWFQGTVATAATPDFGPWQGSPWRMLQITWDEPEVLQNAKRVSPWQVEIVAPAPTLHAAFHPAKKLRAPENSGMLTDGERELFFPMSGLPNSTMGYMPSLLSYNTFPAGMQGARQDSFSFFGLSNSFSANAPQMCTNYAIGNYMVPKLQTVSTELNIGSPQSENLSPDSQSSVSVISFQLFGQVIDVVQPVRSAFDDGRYTEDNGTKGYNEPEGVRNTPDVSLTSSYTELLNRVDVPVEAYSQ